MARNPLSPFRSGGLMGGGFGGDPFMSLHRQMNRLFDDVLRESTGQMPSSQGQGNEGGILMPHMDVSETDKELKVCAELPRRPCRVGSPGLNRRTRQCVRWSRQV